MKMKIFSLMLIAVLAMSMVSSASAYGHDDIRAGTLGYLSCSQIWKQSLYFTNNPDIPTNPVNIEWRTRSKNDNDAREYIDVTKDAYYGYNDLVCWNASLNSKHVLRFWLDGGCVCTPSMTINDVDYSKGLFIAADFSWGTHTAAIYYYDTYGRARTNSLTYSH
jgi:hypothetical protein